MQDEKQEATDATETAVPDAPAQEVQPPDWAEVMAHPQFHTFLQMEVMVRAFRDQIVTAAYDEVAQLPDGQAKSEALAATQLMSSIGQLANGYLSLCKASVGWQNISLLEVPKAVAELKLADEEKKVAVG